MIIDEQDLEITPYKNGVKIKHKIFNVTVSSISLPSFEQNRKEAIKELTDKCWILEFQRKFASQHEEETNTDIDTINHLCDFYKEIRKRYNPTKPFLAIKMYKDWDSEIDYYLMRSLQEEVIRNMDFITVSGCKAENEDLVLSYNSLLGIDYDSYISLLHEKITNAAPIYIDENGELITTRANCNR